jgi:hypothetical protein
MSQNLLRSVRFQIGTHRPRCALYSKVYAIHSSSRCTVVGATTRALIRQNSIASSNIQKYYSGPALFASAAAGPVDRPERCCDRVESGWTNGAPRGETPRWRTAACCVAGVAAAGVRPGWWVRGFCRRAFRSAAAAPCDRRPFMFMFASICAVDLFAFQPCRDFTLAVARTNFVSAIEEAPGLTRVQHDRDI